MRPGSPKPALDKEVRLTLAALEQLDSYVADRDEPDHGGWYYGNREQFEKRHNTIRQWLVQEIYKARLRMP